MEMNGRTLRHFITLPIKQDKFKKCKSDEQLMKTND